MTDIRLGSLSFPVAEPTTAEMTSDAAYNIKERPATVMNLYLCSKSVRNNIKLQSETILKYIIRYPPEENDYKLL